MSEKTYDYVIRSCSHPLLLQCRTDSDAFLDQLPKTNDLEQRLISRVFQLVRSPKGHRIYLGNRSILQLEQLSNVLTAIDTTEAIETGLLNLSRQLVQRIDHICERRKQAKYLEEAASLPTTDPILLDTSKCNSNQSQTVHPQTCGCAQSVLRNPLGQATESAKTSPQSAVYHVEGSITTDDRVPNNVKRFKTRRKAEEFVVSIVRLGQPPRQTPAASNFTDGSASKATARAGWGVHVRRCKQSVVTNLWNPVLTIPTTRIGSEHCGVLITWQKSAPFIVPFNGSSPRR